MKHNNREIKLRIEDGTLIMFNCIIAHEYFKCETAFNHYVSLSFENIKTKQDVSKEKKIMLYNAYAIFIQMLYEYFLACLKSELKTTKKIDPNIIDKAFVDEVNKINKIYIERIDKNIAPAWINNRKYYEKECPKEFGTRIREIRNINTHVDLRRITITKDKSLASFYKKYHWCVMQIFDFGREIWSMRIFPNIDLGEIELFYEQKNENYHP